MTRATRQRACVKPTTRCLARPTPRDPRSSAPWRWALLSVVALLVLWAGYGFPHPLPTTEDELAGLFGSLGAWTYLIAGGLAFLEVGTPMGLVAPLELAVPFAGAATTAETADLVPLVGVVWVCASAGDSVNFLAGKLLGRRFVERHGHRVRITPARLHNIDHHFDRHGQVTIVLGRFGAFVRTLTPFLAGAGRMPYRRFLPASIAGSGLWAATLSTLGYVLANSLSLLSDTLLVSESVPPA